MSSCVFGQLVSQVAAMLRENASQEDVDRFLEKLLLPAYRAEVLAAAQDIATQAWIDQELGAGIDRVSELSGAHKDAERHGSRSS